MTTPDELRALHEAATSAPCLGDKVLVRRSDKLTRGSLDYKLPRVYCGSHWPQTTIPNQATLYGWHTWPEMLPATHRHTEPQEAVFLGWRTLTDGYRDGGGMRAWDDYEPPTYYTVASYRAAVVCFSERENPVYVYPSAISLVESAPLREQVEALRAKLERVLVAACAHCQRIDEAPAWCVNVNCAAHTEEVPHE